MQFVTVSIESGLESILSADENEHMVKVILTSKIQKLGLVEKYHDNVKNEDPDSYFRSRN